MRSALTALICQALSDSILYQEDPDEPILWLAALPMTRRAPDAEAPDGTHLTDESDSVIHFLDDCMQRCLKTPYRYIEELHALAKASTDDGLPHEHRLETFPSPLLMTLLEQLRIQVSLRRLSPSDVLALATFVRKLMFKLSAKQRTLKLLHAMTDEVDRSLSLHLLFPERPIVSAAIRREVSVLHHCLGSGREYPTLDLDRARDELDDFLNQIECLPLRKRHDFRSIVDLTLRRCWAAAPVPAARVESAFELVDWLRLIDVPLTPGDIRRLAAVVGQRHKPALQEFCLNLHPAHGLFWEGLDIVSGWRPFLEQRMYVGAWYLALSLDAECLTELNLTGCSRNSLMSERRLKGIY